MLEEERRKEEIEIGQGGATERKVKRNKSGQRAERRQAGREEGSVGEEVKGWKHGDIAAERMV